MPGWRFGRGWSDAALAAELARARGREPNFDMEQPKGPATGWRRHHSETVIGREGAGPPAPGDVFEAAWDAITRFAFSDPRIVRGYFDPAEPLDGRCMVLVLRALRLHFLAAVRVGAVRRDYGDAETIHGYRYDTLRGHIEAGSEWFLLSKSHATGEVRFRIDAVWRPGDFPNEWSRLGFRLLGPHYQRRWTRRAHQRLRQTVEEIVESDRPAR